MRQFTDTVDTPPFAVTIAMPGTVRHSGLARVPAIHAVVAGGPLSVTPRADTVNPGDEDEDDDEAGDGGGGGNIDPDVDEGYGDDDEDDDDEDTLWARGAARAGFAAAHHSVLM